MKDGETEALVRPFCQVWKVDCRVGAGHSSSCESSLAVPRTGCCRQLSEQWQADEVGVDGPCSGSCACLEKEDAEAGRKVGKGLGKGPRACQLRPDGHLDESQARQVETGKCVQRHRGRGR